jgi:hypothetical protein
MDVPEENLNYFRLYIAMMAEAQTSVLDPDVAQVFNG